MASIRPQAARLLQSVPPVDREAENALLGCLLLEPTCLAEVHEFVRKAEDFSDPRNARLFAAIAAISDTEPSWQVQELASKLDAEGQLESIGGTDRIASLIEAMPSAAEQLSSPSWLEVRRTYGNSSPPPPRSFTMRTTPAKMPKALLRGPNS